MERASVIRVHRIGLCTVSIAFSLMQHGWPEILGTSTLPGHPIKAADVLEQALAGHQARAASCWVGLLWLMSPQHFEGLNEFVVLAFSFGTQHR